MKTYLYPNSYTRVLPTPELYRKVIFLFFLLSLSLMVLADNGSSNELTFKNAKLESGTAGADGAIYRFPQVGNNIDALVKIIGRSSNKVRLVSIDLTNTGWQKAFQPQVTYDGNASLLGLDWWMEFEISFVQKDKTNPVTVNNFDITALDIDGDDNKFNEYVSFYKPKSYTMERGSLLSVTNLLQSILGLLTPGKRFDGPKRNYSNIDTSATGVMVTNNYENTNAFHIRTGGQMNGSGTVEDRMYSVYFKSFAYQVPVEFTLPLVLNSFNASLDNKKVVLNWQTGMEKDLSHFVVEKSTNGKDYTEAGIVFTAGNSGVKKEYVFNDPITGTSDVLYYRLKMVDMDKRYQNSAIRVIKMSNSDVPAEIKLQAYPNPVVNEVRITIPATWQNKQVNYDVFNTNGQRVKHFTNNTASQTETVNMQDLGAGLYFIKASTGNQTAMQRIIKK
jgi:Secretion system C-terminal sorting domain